MKLRLATLLTVGLLAAIPASAQEKLNFLSSWRAQAEHGGYYQAVAKGFYKACGLDVAIRMGGPGTDAKALLAGGAVDAMMGSYTDDPFRLNEAGFEAKAVAASFQKSPQIFMTHQGNGIEKIEDMRGKPILIAQSARTTYWPFLRARYGFQDAQIRPYTFQMGPWLIDKNAIQQGFVSSEPFKVKTEGNVDPKIFLFADFGYLSYSSLIVFPTKYIKEKPKNVQCFVDGTIDGWNDYLKDPTAGNALIQKDNPDNTPELMAFAVETMKKYELIVNDDARKFGIGAITEERFKGHFEMMRDQGLYKPDFDWRSSFTLDFINKRRGL